MLTLGRFYFMRSLYSLALKKVPLSVAFALSRDFYPDQKADFQGHSAGPNPERWSETSTMNWNQRHQPEVTRFSSVPPSRSCSQGCKRHFSLYLWREAPQAPIHQLPWHRFEQDARRPGRGGTAIVITLLRNTWFHNLYLTADTWKVEHFGKMHQAVMFLLWDPLAGEGGVAPGGGRAQLSITVKSAVLAASQRSRDRTNSSYNYIIAYGTVIEAPDKNYLV